MTTTMIWPAAATGAGCPFPPQDTAPASQPETSTPPGLSGVSGAFASSMKHPTRKQAPQNAH